MKVLVTGGAGYIGSHVCKALFAAGHAPIVFDNFSTGHRWAVKWGPLVEGDLCSPQAIAAAIRDFDIEAVIHLAASSAVGESVAHPRKYFENNVRNTINLLGVMLDAGVNYLVFSSTAAVYGVPERVPISEEHVVAPVNPYGTTKAAIERMLSEYSTAYGQRYVALRYFNASGADIMGEIGESHRPETHLVPIAIEAALGLRPELVLFGTDYPTADGTAVRDYVHVMDLAVAHVQALDYLVSGGTSTHLNLGTGRGYSVREVIEAVERATGFPVPVVEAPRRKGDPPVLVADSRRASVTLDWAPEYSDLDRIVRSAWEWHRHHG